MCFVSSICILSSQLISPTKLEQADTMLKVFVNEVGNLYSIIFWSLEMHMLLHLCDQG